MLTDISGSRPITDTTFTPTRATQQLRLLQRVNAAASGLTGLAMAVTSGWLGVQVDLPRPLVLVLGVGLVGWAALLVWLAAQPARRLVTFSTPVAAGDAAWVIGTAAALVLRDPTAIGSTLAAGTAAVVGVFAVEGFVLAGRARRATS